MSEIKNLKDRMTKYPCPICKNDADLIPMTGQDLLLCDKCRSTLQEWLLYRLFEK